MNLAEQTLAQIPPGGSATDARAELALVGAVLSEPRLLDEHALTELRPCDVYRGVHRDAFEFALHRGPDAGPAEIVELAEWLERGKSLKRGTAPLAVAAEILDAGAIRSGWEAHARYVKACAVRRRAVEAAVSLWHRAMEPPPADTPEDLVADAARMIGTLGAPDARNVHDLADLGRPFLSRIERAMVEGSPAMSTGFPELDAITGGGLHAGDLTVIGARPSCGKTSLARNIARNLAVAGHPVLFVSLEVSERQLYADLVTGETGIPAQLLRSGKLNDDQRARVVDAADWLSTGPMARTFRVARTGRDLQRILAAGRSAARLHGFRVVVVDYLQLVRVRGQKEKRYEVTEVSNALKELAQEHDVCSLALAQLSRKADDDPNRRPRMSDLKESGDIEQDADQVLLLHRPDLAARRGGKSSGPPVERGTAELHVVKNRQGPTGELGLTFDGRSMAFRTRYGGAS